MTSKKKSPGRPPINGEPMKRIMVHMDKKTLEALETIDENRSKAVREAVKIASETRAE